jgi:hypothetical protein
MLFAFGLLVIALLILSVWNFIIFRRLKSSETDKKLDDPRYWELKYRMDYLVAITAMGLTVIAFFGYESLQSAKEAVKSEIEVELATIRKDVGNTEKVLADLNLFSDSIRDDVSASGAKMRDQINRQVATLKELERKIRSINNRNIVQQEFYVVRSLKLPINHETKPGSNRVFFKDMITDKGDKLPDFENPPLVIPISQSTMTINIFNIKTDSFEAYWGGESIGSAIPEVVEYSVVIIGEIKTFDRTFDKSFK